MIIFLYDFTYETAYMMVPYMVHIMVSLESYNCMAQTMVSLEPYTFMIRLWSTWNHTLSIMADYNQPGFVWEGNPGCFQTMQCDKTKNRSWNERIAIPSESRTKLWYKKTR